MAPKLAVIILGSGSSSQVPSKGCRCGLSTLAAYGSGQRNARRNTSAIIQSRSTQSLARSPEAPPTDLIDDAKIFNQLLAIANPSTAGSFGGEVLGGVPLAGGFYPTPTPISPVIPLSVDPTSSRSNLGARPTAPSSSTQPPPRSSTPLGTPSTQVPRITSSPAPFSPAVPPTITNSPTSRGPFSSITPMVYSAPPESRVDSPDSPGRPPLPAGVIAGIAAGFLLLVTMALLVCWCFQRRRRATRAKRRTQRESSLHNPILNTLMAPNQSSASFRGTPYPGGEVDMYNGGRPSMARNTCSSFGPAFRHSRGHSVDEVEDSRLNEVNYLEVMGDRPPMASLRPMEPTVGELLRANLDKGSNTYTNSSTQQFPQDAISDTTDDHGSFRARRSTYRSGFSAGSLIFPEVAKFRSVPKNEAGIPIQNLEANRVQSQTAAGIFGFDDQEYDQGSDSDNRDSQKVDPHFPSFYLPRAGDPKKISITRVDLPTQSMVSRTTNFSYPMPQVVPSPPPVPGSILNRPRYKYGHEARRDEATQPPSSPPSHPTETTTTRPGSTATPGFANNRYIPTKGKKRKTNANVLSVLHKSSLRKSSAKSMLPNRQSILGAARLSIARFNAVRLSTDRLSTVRRVERNNIASVSSIDIPDPYVVVK